MTAKDISQKDAAASIKQLPIGGQHGTRSLTIEVSWQVELAWRGAIQREQKKVPMLAIWQNWVFGIGGQVWIIGLLIEHIVPARHLQRGHRSPAIIRAHQRRHRCRRHPRLKRW